MPFKNITPDQQDDYMEYDNANKVLVSGFVYRPGAHYFRPGFSVKDYIALSGGSLDVGAANRVKILKKDGATTTLANNKWLNQVILLRSLKHIAVFCLVIQVLSKH